MPCFMLTITLHSLCVLQVEYICLRFKLTAGPDLNPPTAGPQFGTSAFGSESLWGTFSQRLFQRKNPSSTINHSYRDLIAVWLASLSEDLLKEPSYWCPEKYVTDRDIKLTLPTTKTKLGNFSSAADFFDLHCMYSKLFPAFGDVCTQFINNYYAEITTEQRKELTMWIDDEDGCVKFIKPERWLDVWGEMRRGIGDLGEDEEFSEIIRMIRDVGIVSDHIVHKFVEVGPVRFTANWRDGEGDWALCRPPAVMQNAEGEMITQPQFGRVKAVYTHKGPNGDSNVVLRMEWFKPVEEGEDLYHPEQRNPLVGVEARTDRLDVMWLAKDLIPIICWAAPDFDHDERQIMLSRSWGILRVLGFPVQPYLDDPYEDVAV